MSSRMKQQWKLALLLMVFSPLLVEVHRPEARVAWRRYEIGDDARPSRVDVSEGRVLRLFSTPEPLRRDEETGRVVCFTGTGLRCQVARISQPYRLSGEWWGADEYARALVDI